jgi:hypothetical protein
MKTLKTWIIVGLLALASLLSTTSNAFAQTTGNYVIGDQRSGQFSVPANLETGVTLTNKTNQEVKVNLSAEGTWNLSNDIKNLDANGLDPKYLPSDSLKYLQYPDKTPFSLVAASQDKDQPRAYQVGTKSELTIAPGATFAFLVNDIRSAVAPDSYKDNTGSIVVKWSTPAIIQGGNTATDRQYADGRNNFYLVDTNNPITGSGKLTKWNIWAKNTLPVQLVIYRQGGNSWSVVGTSDVKTPVVGANSFTIPTPIQVEKGDFVGLYYPQQGSASFSLDNNSPSDFGNLSGKVLFTASGANPTAFSGSSNRTYSVGVQ